MSDSQSAQSIIVSKLIEAIEKGKISSSGKLPSLTKLAKKHTVSRSTVRRALQILKDRGYIDTVPGKGTFAHDPHTIQRKRIRQSCISFIFPNMKGMFVSDILRGIQSVVSKNNYYLAIFDSSDHLEIEAENLKRALELQSKGIILFPSNHPNPRLSNHESFIAIQKTGTPFLFVDNYPLPLKVDYVAANNYQAIYDLVSYLFEMGHRKIGYISGPTHISSFYNGYRGFCQSMLDYSLEIDPRFIFPNPNEHSDTMDISMREFFNTKPEVFLERLVTASSKPTAFIVIACQDCVLKVFNKHNVKIPDEISIVGIMADYSKNAEIFNRFGIAIPISANRSIELTGSVVSSFALGQKVTEVLMERIEGKNNKQNVAIELDMSLHVGNSVKRIRKSIHVKREKEAIV